MPIPFTGRAAIAAPLGAALLGAALLGAALPPHAAQAQSPALAVPEFAITAGPSSLTAPPLEEVERRLQRIPGNVTLVPAEAFASRPAVTTLRDMLDFTPGVFTAPKWGEDSRLSIRGSGLSRSFHLRGVRLSMDGMPVNQADGGADIQEIDPLAYRSVRVYRGAAGFALGADTLGGAIDFATPTGREAPGALLRFDAGLRNYFREHLAYGMASGDWDAWAGATQLNADGYRDHSQTDSRRFSGNIGWRPTDDLETRFYVNYSHIEQYIPGSVTRAQALSSARRAAAGNLAQDYQRNIEAIRLGNRTTIRLSDGVRIETGLSFVHRELDHPIFQYVDNRTDDIAGFARLVLEGDIAGLRNTTVIGADLAIGSNESRRFVNNRGHAGALTFSSLDRARSNGLYIEDSLWLRPDLALIAGVRGAEAFRGSRDRFLSDGDQSGSTTYRSVNPRFGFIWQASEQAQLFGNYAWSTEAPTLSELISLSSRGFGYLKPQRAQTAEIGTRGRSRDVTWEIAAYRSTIRDELQQFTESNGATFVLNAERTVHQGIEAALDWIIGRRVFGEDSITLRQAYTYSDFRFDGDRRYDDNQLPGAPRHLYRAELRWKDARGPWLGPNIEWMPVAMYADNANSLKTDSYLLVGLRGGWDFDSGIAVFVEGRNLANKRYIASTSVLPVATAASALFEPGEGRSVFGGLQYRF